MVPGQRLDQHAYYPIVKVESEVRFSFNGKAIRARKGDTIAAALFGAGVRIFSRSFKYHRPRGLCDVQGLGPEALLTVNHEPNVRADKTRVREGMEVRTQNAWPSVGFDLMAVNNWLVPLLPNGFYYKMFHKPRWLWPIAEKGLRRAAGLGKIDTAGHAVDARYEKIYRFPDVCVVGSGPAGLAATQAALEEGKKVLLVEEDDHLGGHSIHTLTPVTGCMDASVDGRAEHEAIGQMVRQIEGQEQLEILGGASAIGLYEDNLVAVRQGLNLYKIRAGAVVLATGASDRHLVFENNDKPGIMSARGVERLIALHAIRPGRRAIVVTTHEGGYHTAKMLHGAGTEVAAIVDARPTESDSELAGEIEALRIPVYRGETIHSASGRRGVKVVTVGDIACKGAGRKIACDLLVMAVGYKPQLSLLSMSGGRPVWDDQRGVLRVRSLPAGVYAAGEVNGHAAFSRLYAEGWANGKAAVAGAAAPESVRESDDNLMALPADIEAGGKRHFICKCMDVTRKEACASIAEGYDQVETLKRYTGMGMGPCQGKSCYEAVARLAAQDTGLGQGEAAPTTMRPPFVPISFGALAGRARHLMPVRRTAMHHCHAKAGATFLNAGQWKRPHSYTDAQAEAKHVREGLGMIDVSTLGKIGLSGPQVMEFLHFMFPGKYRQLAVGKTRYATMIGEDGILFEDGTLSHIEEGKYYLSTTTGNQDAIFSLFWWWITTDHFEVQVSNLGPVYAAVNISGPRSREFLSELVDIDLSNDAFPYMTCGRARVAQAPALIFRIGFTGELSYELHFPSEYGESMWQFLMERGEPYGLKPFGLETQRILRLEKGHLLPGVDTDALSNPYEAGVGFTIKDDKEDFIGKAFLNDFKQRDVESRLVAYKLEPGDPIPDDGVAVLNEGKLMGRVTSSRLSPTLGYGIGLAWVGEELSQPGSRFQIRLADGGDVFGEVLDHAAYDPEGVRLKS